MEMSLSKIADIMQMSLMVHKGTVFGEACHVMTTEVTNLKLPLPIRAKALLDSPQVGVLFRVAGDLYLLVAHNPGEASSAYVIDAANCTDFAGKRTTPEAILLKNLDLRATVALLGSAIKASFFRQGASWKPLSL